MDIWRKEDDEKNNVKNRREVKVIDAFLFFQELDLLEIRLAYLDAFVDTFVIVEACQTFSGKRKEFVFEKNRDRYARYLDKIEYYKIVDFHENYKSLSSYLSDSGDPVKKKIFNYLEKNEHCPKNELNWILDAYHRECIHLALEKIVNHDDVVLLSDLDEIPSINIFSNENMALIRERPRVCQQKEFRYFLNYYKDSDWLGTIAGLGSVITQHSLNWLRFDSKELRTLIYEQPLFNAGYHFTSCGDVEMIKEKIKSWGHQEYNNSSILKNVEKNILSGQDIFLREAGTNLKNVSAQDMDYYDIEMSSIVSAYPHMLSEKTIQAVRSTFIHDVYRRVLMTMKKIQYKVSIRLSGVNSNKKSNRLD